MPTLRLKTRFLVLIWAASCVLSSAALDQKLPAPNKPDFTGAWMRNLSKSKNNRWPLGSASVTLTILHKEPEIAVTRKSDRGGKGTITEGIYYTDGRGEKNAPRFQDVFSLGVPGQSNEMRPRAPKQTETRSKTKWEGNKLVSRWALRAEVLGNQIDLDVTERYELSADGKTLTIATTVGRSTLTEVFDRIQ